MCKIDYACMRVEEYFFSWDSNYHLFLASSQGQTSGVSAVKHHFSLIPHISAFLCDVSSECFVLFPECLCFLFVFSRLQQFHFSYFLCILEQVLSCKESNNNGELVLEVDL